MKSTWRTAVILSGLLLSAAPSGAQVAGTSPTVLAPKEMETFLLNAPIVAKKGSPKGVTDARRVTLADGHVTHDAQVQDVNIEKPFFDVGPKNSEINFKDLYRYNVAAYRLSLFLGLDNIPMSVERVVEGKPAAMTWWVDGVAMDENARQKKHVVGPNPLRTYNFIDEMYVFDELIQNRDRNGGNLLWTSDWKAWLIDHTRAFRLDKKLLKPERLQRCDRTLLERMRGMTAASLADAVGTSLTKPEMEAMLARRDVIVQIFDRKIAEKTEAAVLYALR